MKKTVTKKITGLLVLLFVFISFASWAQTEKTKQQKQDEQGAALKKWFDEGEIIIEGQVEDWKNSTFKNSSGEIRAGLCIKVKINRVLKGKINPDFVNLKTPGLSNAYEPENVTLNLKNRILPDYWGSSIFYSPKTAFLIKIKKSTVQTGECFIVENEGIYTETGQAKTLYFLNEKANSNFDNSVYLYQMLQNYCNVKVDLKEIQKQQDKRQAVQDSIETGEMIKNYKPTPQEIEKNKRNNARADSIIRANRHRRDTTNLKKKIKLKSNSNRTSNAAGCTDLYLSEYLCGQGNQKSIEVYNPTSSPINLSGYSILIYHGSSYTPTTIALTGTISAFATHVVSKPNASAAILAHTNQTSNNLNFNGDEIIVLNKAAIHIDKIGVIGTAIGSGGWTLTPTGSTVNTDLRRKYNIGVGDTNWTNCKAEFDVFPSDSTSNLGIHFNICGVDPDLNLTIANATIVGNNFEFDVMATSTGSSGTYLDNADVAFRYNVNAFGLNAVTNGNVTVTLGSALTAAPHTNTYLNPQGTLFNGLDTVAVDFTTDYSQTSWNRILIPSSPPTQILHYSMVITNCNKNTNLQLFAGAYDSTYDEFVANYNDDPSTATNFYYTNRTYGALNSTIPPCATNPQITGFNGGYTPNSVIAGADYTGLPSGESLLTINGSGFGNIKGTVYMANAVNNSAPYYIPLDNGWDIKNWSPTQITLLVPSVMFPVGTATINLNYPGTGYIYVKANGATDSAVSLTMVQVPYALLNKNAGTSYKERVPFAYRQLFSTTSFNIDTTAYDFRFDVATVTNNVQTGGTNCRALLKRTIEDWACKIPIKYRIGRDTTITSPTADGISYINFSSTLSNPAFGAETNVRINNSCSTGHLYATEADISFNSTVNWFYVSPSLVPNNTPNPNMQGGSFADFFTTALHELGHASLLLHVNQTSDLMYFHIPNTSGTGPYISTADSAGGRDNLNWSKTVTIGSCPYNPFTIPASGATTCVDPETGTVGIEEIGNGAFQVSIYPNPAADFINVTFTKQTESSNTIKLVNVIGQTVFYSNIGKNEGAQEVINLQSISKGVYLLIITDNGSTITKKIIVE